MPLDTALTLPALEVTGEYKSGVLLDAALALPAFEASGEIPNFGVAGLEVEFQVSAQVFAGNLITVSATLPRLEVSATLTAENLISASFSSSRLEVSASLISENLISVSASLPRLDVSATAIAENLISVTASLVPPQVSSTVIPGNVATVGLTLVPFELNGQHSINIKYQAALALLPFGLDASVSQAVEESYRGVTVNLRNTGISEYHDFGFNSACIFAGKILGANNEGIHFLDGDRDSDTEIDAEVRTGVVLDPASPAKKRMTDAYLSIKTDGGFVFGTVSDRNVIHEYQGEDGKTSVHNGKVDLGRGVLSNYWGATFKNREGADFELESIELITSAGNRL